MVACSGLPKVPGHVQYGVHADINPPGFYGVHNETKDQVYRKFDDPAMKAGQCLSADDYKAMQAWIKTVKDIVESECK